MRGLSMRLWAIMHACMHALHIQGQSWNFQTETVGKIPIVPFKRSWTRGFFMDLDWSHWTSGALGGRLTSRRHRSKWAVVQPSKREDHCGNFGGLLISCYLSTQEKVDTSFRERVSFLAWSTRMVLHMLLTVHRSWWIVWWEERENVSRKTYFCFSLSLSGVYQLWLTIDSARWTGRSFAQRS